jgi:hypothetical protein
MRGGGAKRGQVGAGADDSKGTMRSGGGIRGGELSGVGGAGAPAHG